MTDRIDVLQAELDEVGAMALAQSALWAALLTVLEVRAGLTKDDVNEMFEIAQTSLEKAEPASPRVIRNARRNLDQTARNLTRR